MRHPDVAARQHAIELLKLRAGESVLLSGVGTGLDLPYIPTGVKAVGIVTVPFVKVGLRLAPATRISLLRIPPRTKTMGEPLLVCIARK